MLSKLIAVGAALLGSMLLMSTAQAEPQRGYGGQSNRVECTSQNYRFTRCGVNWRSAELVRQTSQTLCVRGQTYGVDRNGLWVDRGCGGIFADGGRGGYRGSHQGGGNQSGWNPGPGWDRDIRLTCQSDDYRYRMCQVDTGQGSTVRIERQISNTACIEGRTWGWNRAGIWVSGGCAATFRVSRRWR